MPTCFIVSDPCLQLIARVLGHSTRLRRHKTTGNGREEPGMGETDRACVSYTENNTFQTPVMAAKTNFTVCL